MKQSSGFKLTQVEGRTWYEFVTTSDKFTSLIPDRETASAICDALNRCQKNFEKTRSRAHVGWGSGHGIQLGVQTNSEAVAGLPEAQRRRLGVFNQDAYDFERGHRYMVELERQADQDFQELYKDFYDNEKR